MLDKHSNECYNNSVHLLECMKGDKKMIRIIEKLWNEYLSDECADISAEEKALTKEAIEKHEILNKSLTNEQNEALDEYLDAFCAIHSTFAKKAFFKGCEFTASFLIETIISKKT